MTLSATKRPQGAHPFVGPFDLERPLVFTVPGVLRADECAALVARIEAAGPALAPITTARGFVYDSDIRNNARVIFDDVALAAELWRRVGARVPAEMYGGSRRAVSANERLRCYRYDVGQYFAPHSDGAFRRSASEVSLYTFLIYLNDGFEGGETTFLELDQKVVPKAGMALFFQHRLMHEGCAVTRGRKYALRSDVMYADYPEAASAT